VVVAEARHVRVLRVRDVDDHLALLALADLAVDLDVDDVGRRRGRRRGRGLVGGCAHAAFLVTSTMLRPPLSIMYSNSWRKCLRKLCTGHAAASPSAQMVWPSMRPATSTSSCRSDFCPSPAMIRRMTRFIQPVPSRHGVHWPQDSLL